MAKLFKKLKTKLIISPELAEILDTKYHLSYDEDTPLGYEDVVWLLFQVYRKGREDIIDDLESAFGKIKNTKYED